ncbi:hypothetical protein BHE74_00003538, partial [Ensete ventricosum]
MNFRIQPSNRHLLYNSRITTDIGGPKKDRRYGDLDGGGEEGDRRKSMLTSCEKTEDEVFHIYNEWREKGGRGDGEGRSNRCLVSSSLGSDPNQCFAFGPFKSELGSLCFVRYMRE